MSKGTPSMGKMNKFTHIACRRCGRITFHAQKKVCSACGFGKSSKITHHGWNTKRSLKPTH